MSKRNQANPYCPVHGCRTKSPHTGAAHVRALLAQRPETIVLWTKLCMVELIQSVIADLNAPGVGRVFAYLTRWRDPEELYYRALYALLIAPHEHLPHIFSGEMPNGFSAIWREVNAVIHEGRGTLLKEQTDPGGNTFTPMDLLNQNAHNSYFTMLMTFGVVQSGSEWKLRVQKHVESWQRRVEYLNHIEGLFRVGRDETVVLKAITNMHRPRESWNNGRPAASAVKLVKSALLKKGPKYRYLVIDQPAHMADFRFRLHVGDTPNWDEKNMIFARTGGWEDLLQAFNADLEAVKHEGWIEEGSSHL